MQEELSLHEEEGEVVQSPADDQERADFVVVREFGCERQKFSLGWVCGLREVKTLNSRRDRSR
jgi:hypothetical protein